MENIFIGDLNDIMPLDFRCIDGPCRGMKINEPTVETIYITVEPAIDINSQDDPQFPALKYACYELVLLQIPGASERYKVYRLNRSKSEF